MRDDVLRGNRSSPHVRTVVKYFWTMRGCDDNERPECLGELREKPKNSTDKSNCFVAVEERPRARGPHEPATPALYQTF